MHRLLASGLLFAATVSCVTATTDADKLSCAASQNTIEKEEHQEASVAQMELLQFGSEHTKLNRKSGENRNQGKRYEPGPLDPKFDPNISGSKASVMELGGDHRYLLVRPCARFAGDGMSGLPRHLVTGECCGDLICSSARFESFDNCPQDCLKSESSDDHSLRLSNPPTESSLFGVLEGMEHDEYHCMEEGHYIPGCSKERNYSVWLESLLERNNNGTLPFDLPPPGSIAVELGCGQGQDSRNIASMAGYTLTAVDVSPTAIELAKNKTKAELMGTGPGQIEYVAYDAMALPVPNQRVDFFFDATVYCSLRHEYLSKLYAIWSRLFTPGHTLVHIQCWNWEYQHNKSRAVPRTEKDMRTDFEPLFDILHSERCQKNQDGPGWCFYMKLKSHEERKQLEMNRLKMQQAARDGDIAFVSQNLDARSEKVSSGELKTLYYIAKSNGRVPLMKYLRSIAPSEDDPFFEVVYGTDAVLGSVEKEDNIDASESVSAQMQLSYQKIDWERAELGLILQARIDRLEATGAEY